MTSFKPSPPRSPRGGFTFTLAALLIVLVLISSCSTLQALPISITATAGNNADPYVQSQGMKSMLFGAAEAAMMSGNSSSAAAYIDAALSYQNFAGTIGTPPGGTGSGLSPQSSSSLPGSFMKVVNGTGAGSTITVTGVPSGGAVAVADRNLAVVTVGTSSGSPLVLNTPATLSQGWVIVYTQDAPQWSYSGTVSPSYKYTLSSTDFTITSSSWTPPAGFQQVLVYGAPQLSLIRIYQDTTLKASAVKDLSSQYAALIPAGTPFTGQITVTGAVAWINTDVKSGDVYEYVP